MKMRCTRCGSENPSGSRFCENCGAVLQAEERRAPQPVPVRRDTAAINNRICPNCGSLIEDGAPFCVNCGQSMYEVRGGGGGIVYEEEPESGGTLKMIIIGAAIGLAILAGIFAVMHFVNNDEEDAAVPSTTEAVVEDDAGDMFGDIDEDEDYARDYSGGSDEYMDYANAGENELYRSNSPVFFPDSDQRYLSESELYGMSEDAVQKAINDIYARNGKIFDTQMFQNYYNNQSWYEPESKSDDVVRSYMNDYEISNVEMMSEYNR